MINDSKHLVPDKTIAVIPVNNFDISRLHEFIKPLRNEHKRDWFDKHFYKCLPLSIGNTYGFVVSLPFDLEVHWTGWSGTDALTLRAVGDEPYRSTPHVGVGSHFGFGIFTVNLPVIFRTPPNVNLMTISPPNYQLAGLTPMTGVVETDNLRYIFTLNIRLNVIDTWVTIPRGCPIMGILPVPRYFCDEFKLIAADQLFDEATVKQEKQTQKDHAATRNALKNISKPHDQSYYFGMDIYGNKFKNHQLPFKE
jgi:hypothetical protein